MAYLTFAARLKSFATWPRRTELPTPESLAEAGFYYKGLYTLFYITFNTFFSRLRLLLFTRFFFHYTQVIPMRFRAFTAMFPYAIG